MWKPYLRVVAKKAAQAIHVLDRFHIASHLSKAIDDVRAKEAKALHARGLQPFLTRTRWLLLKRPENLTPKQEIGLGELLLRSNLRSVRAYLLKEDIQRFWTYVSPYWAGVFLDRGCTRVMRSRLEPSLRIPHVPRRRSRPASQPWPPTRAGLHPQILLRSRNCLEPVQAARLIADGRLPATLYLYLARGIRIAASASLPHNRFHFEPALQFLNVQRRCQRARGDATDL